MTELHGAALAAHLKKLAEEDAVVNGHVLHGAALASHLAYVKRLSEHHNKPLHGAALASHLKKLHQVAEAHELHGAALKAHLHKLSEAHPKELHGAALASHLKKVAELENEYFEPVWGADLATHEAQLADEIEVIFVE